MKIKDMEYTDAKKRLTQLYIVGEALELIGGVVAFNTILNSKIISYIGLGLLVVGLFIFICALGIRCSKSYRNLKKGTTEIESLNDMQAEFGTAMIVFALIFILAIFFGAIFLAYYWTHSWIKVVFFLVAFNLINDLRDYFNPEDEEEID